jgi:oxygen-dependent protoporphyrinogen oxidase
MHDVIVIGGGIAGLTCAWQLAKSGAKTLVLERECLPGGNVRTENDRGYLTERGPYSIPGFSRHVWQLLAGLNLESEVVAARPEANDRFVYRGGNLHAIPSGLVSFLTTDLLSLRGKVRLAMEPFVRGTPRNDDSAEQFFVRRFGEEATRYLAGPFVSGVYAGDAAQLEARAAFPLFWQFEQESGSMIGGAWKHFRGRKSQKDSATPLPPRRKGLFSLRGGLGRLVESLAQVLGDSVVCDCAVERIERQGGRWQVESQETTWTADKLVIAIPPPEAATLFQELDPQIGQQLNDIAMAPVAVVHLAFNRETEKVPAGFGFLIPRHYRMRSLGTIFVSRLFDARAPEGTQLLTTFIGGVLDPDVIRKNDEELEAITRQDLKHILGIETTPCYRRVLRHPYAIPQFTRGHLERIGRIRERLAAHTGLALAGNYLTGVGLNDAVHSGYAAASILTGDTGDLASFSSSQKAVVAQGGTGL